MKNPCYDTVTKTDCPRRCAGCSNGCPDWAAYVVERDKMYEQRAIEIRTTRDIIGPHKSRMNKHQKENIHNRTGGRMK